MCVVHFDALQLHRCIRFREFEKLRRNCTTVQLSGCIFVHPTRNGAKSAIEAIIYSDFIYLYRDFLF